MARVFPHLTVGQIKICIIIAALLFLWHTARYMSSNLPSMTRKKTNPLDGTVEEEILPVRVEVFYEALCPDSRSFVLYQLVPTYRKLAPYIDLRMVPYGKAKTFHDGESITFDCQHGPTECLANKVHACALDIVRNQNITLDLISCMIVDNSKPEEIGKMCAKKFTSPWEEIWACAKGDRGSELLEKEGMETATLHNLSFIPTIRIQGNEGRQRNILKDLFHEICRLYEMRSGKEKSNSMVRKLRQIKEKPEPKPAACR